MGIQFRKKKITLHYLDEKPTRYKASQLTYPMVSFAKLVAECSEACGVNKSQTKAVIDALISRLTMYMDLGHGVRMGDFGSFKPTITVKSVKAYDDANANTVRIKKIRFYPGKTFRDMLGELSVRSASEELDDEE